MHHAEVNHNYASSLVAETQHNQNTADKNKAA